MRYKQDLPSLYRLFLKKKSDLISQLYFVNKVRKFGLMNVYRLKKNNRAQNFQYLLGIVAIIKNEAPYLKEWIEFHRIIGVDIFYVYDNDSTDETKMVLDPYIKKGIVKYKFVTGKNKQIDVYKEAIKTYRNEVKWMSILDADEFLVPVVNEDVTSFLDELYKRKHFSQLLVGWLIYGSNGYKRKPKGLVTENYRLHASDAFIADYKPIINPRLAFKMTFPHWVDVIGRTVDENGNRIWGYPFISQKYALPASKNKLRINHYYSKSLSEFVKKSNRGYADYDGINRPKREMIQFKEHDQNVESDHVMDRFYLRLHQKL